MGARKGLSRRRASPTSSSLPPQPRSPMRSATSSASSLGTTLPFAVSFAVRRRYLPTFIALAGLAGTWGLMMAFSWSSKLGVVAFAPWVALVGFDLGVLGGLAIAGTSVVLWVIRPDAAKHTGRNGHATETVGGE